MMMNSNEITVAQTNAIQSELLTSAVKIDLAVANTARKSTKDAGRVHVGGGMMRF
jgi:hypothetical protein